MARSSKIYLCKDINIDNEYNNVLNYTVQQMLDLCTDASHLVAQASNYSFIRETDNTISVSFSYSECLQSNYIAFQNSNYSNKWFFAWIKDVKYVSDGTTQITFEVDAWSTWFNDITLKRSFVIREHVNDDTIGLHTVPEGLETGEYINNGDVGSITDLTDLMIVVGVSDYANSVQGNVRGKITNNIYSGLQYTAFNTTSGGIDALNNYILAYDSAGKASSIVTIFMAPKYLDPHMTSETTSDVLRDNELLSVKTYQTTKNFNLGGYTPKNNKLKCFPYNYLLVSNNNGTSKVYKYELFNTDVLNFTYSSVLTTGCSIRMNPVGYNTVGETSSTQNTIEGIDLGKYPTCSWISDSYTNWLTQNSVNNAANLGLGLGQLVAGLAIVGATGGAGGAALTAEMALKGGAMGMGLMTAGASSIVSTASNYYQNSLVPDSAVGNINNGDVVTASGNNTFRFYHMSIRSEYARIIDDVFTRIGYKVNTTKIPNITGRTYWNYIQINSGEVLGVGAVPTKYMDVINQCARRGVTIWHDHSNIGNYNLDNTIVS